MTASTTDRQDAEHHYDLALDAQRKGDLQASLDHAQAWLNLCSAIEGLDYRENDQVNHARKAVALAPRVPGSIAIMKSSNFIRVSGTNWRHEAAGQSRNVS